MFCTVLYSNVSTNDVLVFYSDTIPDLPSIKELNLVRFAIVYEESDRAPLMDADPEVLRRKW